MINLISNFEYFTKNITQNLRKLEYLSLSGQGYKVTAEVKEILIELPYFTNISIGFKLEDLEYLLNENKKEFEISGLQFHHN